MDSVVLVAHSNFTLVAEQRKSEGPTRGLLKHLVSLFTASNTIAVFQHKDEACICTLEVHGETVLTMRIGNTAIYPHGRENTIANTPDVNGNRDYQ